MAFYLGVALLSGLVVFGSAAPRPHVWRIGQPTKQRRARHGKWRLAALGVVLLMAASVAAFWWRADSRDTSSGTPRLVVDRTDVDLGYRRFGQPARMAFTLTNAGDGVLRVKEVPRVIVKAGC